MVNQRRFSGPRRFVQQSAPQPPVAPPTDDAQVRTILAVPPGQLPAGQLHPTQVILDQITDAADQTGYAVPQRPLAVLRRDTGVSIAIPDQGKYLR